MKARHIILLSLAALPLSAVEEADGNTHSFHALNRGMSQRQMETMDADAAMRLLGLPSFNGEILPATRERLKQVWNSGKGYSDRLDALHAWMKELEKNPNSTDAQVFLAWHAAHAWFASHGEPEHRLFMAHIRHTFSSPKPADCRHLMNLLYQVNMAESMSQTGCNCDDFISIADAINDTNPWLLEPLYVMHEIGASRMDDYNRLWRDPVAYAPQFVNSRRKYASDALRLLLNDTAFLHRNAKGEGLRRWRYTWGKDLPLAVDAAMDYIDARHNGDIASPTEVHAHIRHLTSDLSPDMLGFVPRSILAAAPAANAWKPLWDERASLYEMPDTTAINLPGWDLKLLSREGRSPAEVLAADAARLDELLQKAAGEKTLPAMLAFSLIEDDLALPDETRRSWMNVDGYDTFKAVFDIEVTPHFVDVLIDEKGPHFSKDDEALKASCRELNLTLHRCIVALALMEQQGQREDMQKGCDALAKLLNRSKAWPLVFNEYGLRGITPLALTELVARCNGNHALLKGFTELTSTSITFTAAEHDGNGKPSAKVLAQYMHDMLVLRCDIRCSAQERASVAARWMERAKGQEKNVRDSMAQYCFTWGAPEELLKDIPADPAEYSGAYALRGCCLYRFAAERGDRAAAEKIIRGMTSDPQYYGYPATRLACAMHARAQGRTAEARRFEKDALILAIAEQHYSNAWCLWQANFSYLLHGPVADAVKYQHLRRYGILRDFMRQAVPSLLEQGNFETASFVAEELINLSLRDATPNNSCGTQLQIVCWRAMADIGHALHLYQVGDAATADKLMDAALPLLVCDAETARRVIPVVLGCKGMDTVRKDSFKGTLAAAAQKSKLPGGEEAAAMLKECRFPAVEPAREPDGMNALAAHDLSFESPSYTWHLKDSQGKITEVKGSIVYASYEIDTASSWVHIRLESGRDIDVYLTDVAKDDLKNLLDWRDRNKIELLHLSDLSPTEAVVHDAFGPVNAKICRLYSDSDKPTPENTWVDLLRPYGERLVVRVVNLSKEEQADIMKRPIERDEHPKLRAFESLGEAMAYADANKCSLRACFLGERGGEIDRRFQAEVCGNPNMVRQWNRGFVTVLCYCDKAGNWSEAAEGVFSMARESLTQFLPPDSKQRADFLTGGGTIEIPFDQRTGNLNQPKGVKLGVNVKPGLFGGGTVSADDVAAMSAAIQKGDAETLRRLVKANPALLHQPCGRQKASSPLFDAVMEGKPALVQVLLEEGADPCEVDKHGFPVLGIACLHGNADSVRILLEKGADPNQLPMMQSFSRESPINNALGRPAIIKLLVDHGAKPTAEDLFNVLQRTKDNFEAPDYIMEKCGAQIDLNAKCIFGLATMLQQMTQGREADKVEWLLAHGANAKALDKDIQGLEVPLFFAVCEKDDANDPKSVQILESFLKHGADANAVCMTPGGKIPLLAKCINADMYDHALVLLKYGAKADVPDSGGRPVLYTLAERSACPQNAGRQDKILQVADALLKNGAKPAPLKQWVGEAADGKPRASSEFLKWIGEH